MTPADKTHLADARLMACYLSEGDAEHLLTAEVNAFAHLKRCEDCARRFEQIQWQIESVREEDRTEAAAMFSAEHLETQRNQILRRLEHLGRQARVLRFPAHGPRPLARARGAQATRWVAGAAAAGLAIGLGLGALMNFQLRTPWSRGVAVATSAPARGGHPKAAVAKLTDPSFNDEAFLSEMDQALMRQRAAELEALDALTPHVRDVASRR